MLLDVLQYRQFLFFFQPQWKKPPPPPHPLHRMDLIWQQMQEGEAVAPSQPLRISRHRPNNPRMFWQYNFHRCSFQHSVQRKHKIRRPVSPQRGGNNRRRTTSRIRAERKAPWWQNKPRTKRSLCGFALGWAAPPSGPVRRWAPASCSNCLQTPPRSAANRNKGAKHDRNAEVQAASGRNVAAEEIWFCHFDLRSFSSEVLDVSRTVLFFSES